MSSAPQAAPVSKKKLRAGRILSAFPALLLLFSAAIKFFGSPPVLEEFARLGYPESLVLPIGILELSCTVIYLIPRTGVFGAILLTAYLGGATATHVRIGDPFIGPVVTGVLIWAGLYLREDRLRPLVPLRS